MDINAGDTLYFNNNDSNSTWEVLEAARKAYLTHKHKDNNSNITIRGTPA